MVISFVSLPVGFLPKVKALVEFVGTRLLLIVFIFFSKLVGGKNIRQRHIVKHD